MMDRSTVLFSIELQPARFRKLIYDAGSRCWKE
jgi:hypothetical protein